MFASDSPYTAAGQADVPTASGRRKAFPIALLARDARGMTL